MLGSNQRSDEMAEGGSTAMARLAGPSRRTRSRVPPFFREQAAVLAIGSFLRLYKAAEFDQIIFHRRDLCWRGAEERVRRLVAILAIFHAAERD
jgi:hypothetical protein